MSCTTMSKQIQRLSWLHRPILKISNVSSDRTTGRCRLHLAGNGKNNQINSSTISAESETKTKEVRPVWFVFAGMGSQWPGMGKDLMRFDAFRESVHRSRLTLKNAGTNVDSLLDPTNQSILTNIRDAFNSIAVIQIALYDMFASIGISPSGYLGHSSGEIICAYADGLLSAEKALLIVDAYGRAILETDDPNNLGAMAAVGLSTAEVESLNAPNIVVACHNFPRNTTVSGARDTINELCEKLQSAKIFGKVVNSCGVALHSPLIKPAEQPYLKYMKEIYRNGEGQEVNNNDDLVRSSKWISTCVKEAEWDTPLARKASPEYFAHNLVNPVLFFEAVRHIPENAIVIEIAPEGIFHKILVASVPKTCNVYAPMDRKEEDKLTYFIKCVKDIYSCDLSTESLQDWNKIVESVLKRPSSQTK